MSNGKEKQAKVRFITSRLDPQMKMRVPLVIKELIESEAKRNGRTRAAEIVFRIARGLQLEIKEDQLRKSLCIEDSFR